jgi:hypothetical protein
MAFNFSKSNLPKQLFINNEVSQLFIPPLADPLTFDKVRCLKEL